MIKYIIHISDIHIRTYMYHNTYENLFYKLVNELSVRFEGVDPSEIRIVFTGDLFHQKINISNEQMLIVSNLLRELSEIGNIVIIPGNHDFLMNNLERVDSVTPIVNLINLPNLEYYRDSGVYEDDNIKWVVYSLYQHNQRPEFKNEGDALYVGLYHGNIDGLTTDTGFVFEDSYSTFNFDGCDLALCGDIHKRQTFSIPNNKKGIMIGSLIQQNFGEKINSHGYGIYDVENDDYTFHDLENEKPFLDFKITDFKDIEKDGEILINNGE